MKILVSLLGLILIASACNEPIKEHKAEKKEILNNLPWMQNWFDAWELMGSEVLNIPKDSAPEFLFFDADTLYTTSTISAPNGISFEGPKLFEEELPWRKSAHQGKLTLPDGEKVPVGLMTFASPGKGGKIFFVMAAPSYWRQSGVDSMNFDFDKMLTGVFLHEFAHSRQFNGVGRVADSIERNHSFKKIELSDDIVQDHFRKDSVYENVFRNEVELFYRAALEENNNQTAALIREGLNLLGGRHNKYFQGDKKILRQLDNIFLSMEGTGQYVAVLWLTNSKGGNLSLAEAVQGFRRGKNQWSQEEGLAMYLALDKLSDINWAKDVFGPSPRFILDLLDEAASKLGY